MKRQTSYLMAMLMSGMGAVSALAGQASTSATAENGWGGLGSAAATANYNGHGGIGFARTDSDSGRISRSRGLAVGFDHHGLDLSFSQAVAPKFGPAYAGTFNLSIGLDGSVSGGYGNSVARGSERRSVNASGMTQSNRLGAITLARAGGDARHGRVRARTHTYSRQAHSRRFARASRRPRYARR